MTFDDPLRLVADNIEITYELSFEPEIAASTAVKTVDEMVEQLVQAKKGAAAESHPIWFFPALFASVKFSLREPILLQHTDQTMTFTFRGITTTKRMERYRCHEACWSDDHTGYIMIEYRTGNLGHAVYLNWDLEAQQIRFDLSFSLQDTWSSADQLRELFSKMLRIGLEEITHPCTKKTRILN